MIINTLLVFRNKNTFQDIIYNFEEDKNYKLTISNCIADAMKEIKSNDFDIALIDMNYSDGTGLDLKKQMAEIKDIPTIVVTELNDDMQKVLALEYGADDYLVIPFHILELKARIRAVLRRYNSQKHSEENDSGNIINIDNFEFNVVGRKLKFDGVAIELTGKEFDLLYTLLSNKGKICSRKDLAKTIWGNNYGGHLRTVDVHIRRLREKFSTYFLSENFIQTKWGEGYYYENLK